MTSLALPSSREFKTNLFIYRLKNTREQKVPSQQRRVLKNEGRKIISARKKTINSNRVGYKQHKNGCTYVVMLVDDKFSLIWDSWFILTKR